MTTINKMITVAAPSFALLYLLSIPAVAEVSANIGVTSNYLWRGVTQSEDSAAVSGGVDYESESGFFAGAWISNVSFEGASENETDLYVGYSGEADRLGYSVMYNYYMYSQSENVDFGEVLVDLNFDIVSFGLAYTANDDALSENKDTQAFVTGDIYYYIGVGTDLPKDWSWSLTYGGYDFDNHASDNEFNYSHYNLDVTKSDEKFGEVTVAVSQVLEDEKDVGLDDDLIFSVSWAKTFD